MMKKINQIVLAMLLVLSSATTFAQSDASKDENRIILTSWVPPTIEGMPKIARKNLQNKLKQVLTRNGLAGSPFNSRFIISANVMVMTKDILPGPPPMHAYNLDITLYIGDGYEGTVFASESISVKGVGTNENKAYISALKRINPKNPDIKAFLKTGKEKIVQYYKDNCDIIIRKAQTLADQNKNAEAIFMLSAIPSACEECFVKATNAIKPIYQKLIDRDCKEKLQKATAIWNAAQDMAAAEEAGAMLASIDPDAACGPEARALSKKIAAKVNKIDDREWKYILKDQQQESERIQAIRDIGVAYGNGQPKNVTYKSLW